MSVRSGSPQFTSVSAAALGGANGRTLSLGNGLTLGTLNTLLITWVATATVGSRIPIVRVQVPGGTPLNASAVTLWQVAAAAITAGQTSILALGAGVPASTVSTPLMQFLTLPFDMPLPLNAQVQIFDAANGGAGIDNSDTVAMVANLAV